MVCSYRRVVIQLKRLTLLVLILSGLNMGVAYAHSFSRHTVFLSDVNGGNITLALDFTADTYTVAGNQGRFTNLEMNVNGTWSSLGFRNPTNTSLMHVTHIGSRYIVMNLTVVAATDYEVFIPSAGYPDHIKGAGLITWVDPTLTLNIPANTNRWRG